MVNDRDEQPSEVSPVTQGPASEDEIRAAEQAFADLPAPAQASVPDEEIRRAEEELGAEGGVPTHAGRTESWWNRLFRRRS